MASDTMDHFASLDELAQVIYQGFYRFVVLSTVDEERWTVHLGLSGEGGRWWRGSWRDTDILHFVGSKSSARVLEMFAEKIVEFFIQGDLSIVDWNAEKGTQIKLVVGSTAKKPIYIPLTELSPEEAASHTTSVLFGIALQAKTRRCQLNISPSTFDHEPEYADITTRQIGQNPSRATTSISNKDITATRTNESTAQDEITVLKAELQKRIKTPAAEGSSKPLPAPRRLQGASLANPNKKARKYQEIEFESDDE